MSYQHLRMPYVPQTPAPLCAPAQLVHAMANAKLRADATGVAYLVSAMGHVMMNTAENRALAWAHLCGIHATVKPST